MGRAVILLALVGAVVVVIVAMNAAEQTRAAPAMPAPPAANISGAQVLCTAGDQDKYVYRPERLQVLKPCVRITGTVDHLQIEADGDIHYRIHVDPPYQGLLVEGNGAQGGDLVVEPICYAFPYHADALGLCASNPDSLHTVPQAGDHVWMEGRYVLDIGHATWAELHPLYRWGKAAQ